MELLNKDATDTISPKRIVREVEKRLWKQIEPHTHSDFYYSVITYSDSFKAVFVDRIELQP